MFETLVFDKRSDGISGQRKLVHGNGPSIWWRSQIPFNKADKIHIRANKYV